MLPDFLKDAEVEYSELGAELDGASERGVLWQAAIGRFQIDVPDVARFRVENGRKITIQPAAGCPDERLNQFLRMTPLAALLYQRGILALHAAVVSPPAGQDGSRCAVLLAGDSGAGKSTLAAALVLRGWDLLSDELAVVGQDDHQAVCVWPLPGAAELWPQGLQKLGLPAQGQAEANGRVRVELSTNTNPLPLPLNVLYHLSIAHADRVGIHPIATLERFAVLGKLTYHSHIADALFDRSAYLRLAAQVARSCSFWKLQRPRGKWSLEDLVSIVSSAQAVEKPGKE